MAAPENHELRIIQHFFGGAINILPPPCEFPECVGRAGSLYANPGNYGVALCVKHEEELQNSGQIVTCSVRRVGVKYNKQGGVDKRFVTGDVCTLKVNHIGDHRYIVDGNLSKEWTEEAEEAVTV